MTRWLPAVVVAVLVLLVAGLPALTGDLTSLVVAVSGLVIAWWISPLNGRRGPRHRDVLAAEDGEHAVIIYWRPGCIHCLRLRGALGSAAAKASWVSIWADPEAAAYVRSVNDGNETVPTVVIDGHPHTNPDPQLVRDALG